MVLLLAMMSNGSAAEWVKVRGLSEAGITVYADPTTIRRSGDMVKMLDMYLAYRPVGVVLREYRACNQPFPCCPKQ